MHKLSKLTKISELAHQEALILKFLFGLKANARI